MGNNAFHSNFTVFSTDTPTLTLLVPTHHSKMSFNCQRESIVDKWVSFQDAVIFGVHDFACPETVLNGT